MHIRERIQLAIENAPLERNSVETTNDLSIYAECDDDYPLVLNENLRALPNEAILDAEEPDGLAQLFHATEEVLGVRFAPEYKRGSAMHEQQHYDAAKYLGVTAAQIGLRFFNVERPGYASRTIVQPILYNLNFRTTKLGAALVSAHPVGVSPGDLIDIQAYGYSGIDELADRAIRRNAGRKDGDKFYPVPLGYRWPTNNNHPVRPYAPMGHSRLDWTAASERQSYGQDSPRISPWLVAE